MFTLYLHFLLFFPQPRNGKHVAVLLKVSDPSTSHFAVHRPNTGRQSRPEKLKVLQKKYSKVDPEEAEKWWNMQHESSLLVCSHAFWSVDNKTHTLRKTKQYSTTQYTSPKIK